MHGYTPKVLEVDSIPFCPSQCVNPACARLTIAKLNNRRKTKDIQDETKQISWVCSYYEGR